MAIYLGKNYDRKTNLSGMQYGDQDRQNRMVYERKLVSPGMRLR